MTCRNCTSRVLRVFLHDPTIPPLSRPHFHRRLVTPPPKYIRLSAHLGGRHQSSLSGTPGANTPSDDDYIPFGQPVTNGTFPGIKGENFSGYIGRPPPPPPSPLVDSYEPAVEIIGQTESDLMQLAEEREAEIRRKIEEAWDEEQSNAYQSMLETGLPIVPKPAAAGAPPESESESAVIREGVIQEMKEEDLRYRAQYGAGIKKRGGWKLKLPPLQKPPIQGSPNSHRDERRVSDRTRTEEGDERYSRVIAESVPLIHEIQEQLEEEGARLPPISEFATSEAWDGEKARAGEASEPRAAEKPKGKKSREPWEAKKPGGKKPRAYKAKEFREVGGPSEEGERGAKHARTSKPLDGWEPEHTNTSDEAWEEKGPEFLREKPRKKKWDLPPVEEVERVFKNAVPAPQSKLEHYIANNPRSKIENWKIQKAALQRKFGSEGWKPKKKLSPTAQDWIREIHAKVPEFTTKKLSEFFKISPEAIRRILKSNRHPSPKEAQEQEERWLKRRDKIWDKWIDEGVVQTKGMRKEVQQQKGEARNKWKDEQDAKWDKYQEKIGARRLESKSLRQRASGIWQPDDRHFTPGDTPESGQPQGVPEQDYGSRPFREYRGNYRSKPRSEVVETPQRASEVRQPDDLHFIPGDTPGSRQPQGVPEKDYGSSPRREYRGYDRRSRPRPNDIEIPQRGGGARQPDDLHSTLGDAPGSMQPQGVPEQDYGSSPRREYRGYDRRSRPRPNDIEIPQRGGRAWQPGDLHSILGGTPESRQPQGVPEQNYGSRPRREYRGNSRVGRPRPNDTEIPQRGGEARQPDDRYPTSDDTPESRQPTNVPKRDYVNMSSMFL